MSNSIHIILLTVILLAASAKLSGQSERKYIRQGNSEFSKGNFAESEVLYRKAIDRKSVPDAQFNLGDALYRQDKYEDAGKNFLENADEAEDNVKKSNSYFNLGNSLLNSKKIMESIEAYKNSLKLNPGNLEAKYNLAYAQDLLQQQQQQEQQDQSQQNDQDDQDKQDQKQEQEDKQNQNQNQNQDQNQQPQQPQQPKDQQGDQEQQQTGVSKEDAQRLLDALANDEKKVQEKVKEAKAASQKVRVLINW